MANLDLSGCAGLTELPKDMDVSVLRLNGCRGLQRLPDGLRVDELDISGLEQLTDLPAGLNMRVLRANECRGFGTLPDGLRCDELELRETNLTSLPDDLRVTSKLDLTGCTRLQHLPENLHVGTLRLRGCTSLVALPEGLDVWFLDLQGCTLFEQWPRNATIRAGRLNVRDCQRLRYLPSYVGPLAMLDVSGCPNLVELAPALDVTLWVDIGESGITSLPPSLQDVELRWRGLPIDARIAFRPETITIEEVLDEVNAERRRLLIACFGYERFLNATAASVLDADEDAGGPRQLLRVRLAHDEDLVCLSIRCPSTGRHYVLRVPPSTTTCHQGAAWIAGFDNPDDYHPLIET